MPRKEEPQKAKKSSKAPAQADDGVPKSKLDLSIREGTRPGKDSKKPANGKQDKQQGKPSSAREVLAALAGGAPEPAEKRPAKGKKGPGKQPEAAGGYLDGLDLPSSSSSEDEAEENGRHEPLYTAEDKRNDELRVRVLPCWQSAASFTSTVLC